MSPRARLLGQASRPDVPQMVESYSTAYDEWMRRRKEHYPAGAARRAPVAALVLDVDEVGLLLEALDRSPVSQDPRLDELHRYLRFMRAELEKHR